MRSAVVAAVVIVLVAASLGVGYQLGNQAQRTETLNSTSTQTIISISTSTSTSTLTSTSTSFVSVASGQPIPVTSVETANITIGQSPDPYAESIAVNPNTNRVYVVDGSTLTVLDAASHAAIANVTLPASGTGGIAVDNPTGIVFVSVEFFNDGAPVKGEVAEINGSTNAIVRELPLDSPLGALAYDPSTHVLYGSAGGNPGSRRP